MKRPSQKTRKEQTEKQTRERERGLNQSRKENKK